MCVFSILFLLGLPDDLWTVVFLAVFASVFWLVGIGLMVVAIYMAKQTVMIGIDDGRLFIERDTIFGIKWSDFGPADLRGIEVGPSGTEINEVPVMELHVWPNRGKKLGMLSQLEDAELRWLAKRLRNELGLGRLGAMKFSTVSHDGKLVAPEECPAKVNELPNGDVEILVPAPGLWSRWGGPLFSILVGLLPPIGILVLAANVKLPFELIAFFVTVFPLMAAVNMCLLYAYRSRSFKILASQDGLEIRRRGFFAKRNLVLTTDQVDKVVAEDSGMTVNQDSKSQVVVEQNNGQRFVMMWGRKPDEQAYVAALIQRGLGLENQQDDST